MKKVVVFLHERGDAPGSLWAAALFSRPGIDSRWFPVDFVNNVVDFLHEMGSSMCAGFCEETVTKSQPFKTGHWESRAKGVAQDKFLSSTSAL